MADDTPAIGTFLIKTEDNKVRFKSHFGDGPAIVTEGYAGWQITQRPKDVGITTWAGRNPMAIEIPFMLNFYGLAHRSYSDNPGVECEDMVGNLETLCGIGTHAPPPVCIVDGAGMIPHDYSVYQGHRWVIEQLSWDKQVEIRSQTSGRRLRCGGTITIRQYVSPSDILKRISPSARAVKPTTYRVRRGDNLHKIAAKFYGDANQWKKIADANKLRDHRSLVINKVIRIP